MSRIEKLGEFYLGRKYDYINKSDTTKEILYDARNLTTHAICLGMTGSGKTGLCIGLLEEAALDNVPAIIIDPKGDITNLLLTFPNLLPADFKPWVNLDDANSKKMSIDEYSTQIAEKWKNGLADWGQTPKRIALLKESVDFSIYTPGSDAGTGVSILSALNPPNLSWESEAELLRDQIGGIVRALLNLIKMDDNPLNREYILLSGIIEFYWREKSKVDLPLLINAIQKPPFTKMGVFEIESFFPAKERLKFALALNGLLASPDFQTWLDGDPLDISSLLYTSSGKPKHSIIYLAHLSDSERMFFTTLLLEQIVTWTRQQSGTTSLRALLYFDEVFGFLPPVAEPPSKKPILTLLKQARAYGLGLVLTTQNPMDIDYKAMSNAGTWFIGRLQTENDKKRLLDGLETISSNTAGNFNRAKINNIISSLDSRVFLLHNVHSNDTVVFKTRWVMSYLRGPLTRDQIRVLVNNKKTSQIEKHNKPSVTAQTQQISSALKTNFSKVQPQLASKLKQVFLPVEISPGKALQQINTTTSKEKLSLVYEPVLIALAKVSLLSRKMNYTSQKTLSFLIKPDSADILLDWKNYQISPIDPEELSASREPESYFSGNFPEDWANRASMRSIIKDFKDFLYYNTIQSIPVNNTLKLYAKPDESAEQFQVRYSTKIKEQRDAEVNKLKEQVQKKLQRLTTKLKKEERELEEDQNDFKSRKSEELLSAGESIIGLLGIFGRRRSSALSSATRKRRMTRRAKEDIEESKDEIKRLETEIQRLEDNTREKAEAIVEKWEAIANNNTIFEIKPRRTDVQVELVALAWLPVYYRGDSEKVAAFLPEPVNAND